MTTITSVKKSRTSSIATGFAKTWGYGTTWNFAKTWGYGTTWN